ncbi:MAG: hypothetical protein ABIG28_02190 [archaeon]
MRYKDLFEFIPGIILLVLVVWGFYLFMKSKDVQSKSLKAGILIPLIANLIGFLWWLGDLVNLVDFGAYMLLGLLGGWLVVGVISVIFSVIALVKTKRKSLAWGSLIYGALYIVLWLVFVILVTAGFGSIM